jgi:hypothetical protein
MAVKFSGRGTFILGMEEAAQAFYEQVEQYLKAWQASAPKF